MSRLFEAWKRAEVESAETLDYSLLEETPTDVAADSLEAYTDSLDAYNYEVPASSGAELSGTRPDSMPPLPRPSPLEKETLHVTGWAAEACHAHMASLVEKRG